jgi:hypothetical protein
MFLCPWHETLKYGKALAEGRELSGRKVGCQNLTFESLIIESDTSLLLRHTHFPQNAINCVVIERITPFFWLDGHEMEDSLGVESMTVNLEWLYVDIQVLICFLSVSVSAEATVACQKFWLPSSGQHPTKPSPHHLSIVK